MKIIHRFWYSEEELLLDLQRDVTEGEQSKRCQKKGGKAVERYEA